MNSAFLFPALLIGLSLFGWNASSKRIAQEVAEWEITPQEGRRYVFLYRGWSVVLAAVGVALVILALTTN
jgi:hypothetical protein